MQRWIHFCFWGSEICMYCVYEHTCEGGVCGITTGTLIAHIWNHLTSVLLTELNSFYRLEHILLDSGQEGGRLLLWTIHWCKLPVGCPDLSTSFLCTEKEMSLFLNFGSKAKKRKETTTNSYILLVSDTRPGYATLTLPQCSIESEDYIYFTMCTDMLNILTWTINIAFELAKHTTYSIHKDNSSDWNYSTKSHVKHSG